MKMYLILIAMTVFFVSCSDDKSSPTDVVDDDKDTVTTNYYEKFYAYYPFDGNAVDSSDGEYNGVVSGAIYSFDRNGNESSAIYFDGASHVSLPYAGMLDFDNDFAVAFWAKVGEQLNITNAGHFDMIGNAVWDEGGWFVGVNTFEQWQTMTWLREGVGERIAYDKETYFDNEWHHIVYNFDRLNEHNTTIKLYIDGVEKMAKSTNTPSNQNYEPNIGARVDLASYFTGTIDNLVFHDNLITEADMDTLMGRHIAIGSN